ncbi:MAG TPA: immunoglobulin domain-containing protein, partial [Opitutaceae bacterium]|nr:immunoglobulin domain-containing protein [Opitutaceae bacterium]
TLAYQWAFNGNPISGATGAALTLDSVTAANAGTYTVTVSNAIGSATSTAANLTVSTLLVPPAITGQPQNVTASVGMSATFSVDASGSAPLAYQWQLNGQAIAGATAPTYTIPSVQQSDAGTYTVVVTNSQGAMTSEGASLTVSATPIAPIWQWQPTSTAVTAGGTASFSVGVVGSSPISYQWYKGTTPIPGAIGPAYTIASAQASDAGSYSVVITNPGGTVTSSSASLTVNAAGSPPVPVTIALQPTPVSATIGSSATFSVAVTGDPTVTYQWRKNQAPISGATQATFTVNNVQNSDAGNYDVIVANGFSATISSPTALTVTPVAVPSHLVNISVLGFGGTGPQSLTAGFVVGGSGTTSTLIRGIGPTLQQFGVSNVMADPQLSVYSDGGLVASNDNWGGTEALSAAFSQVGAFSLPSDSLDAALLTSFSPGVYSAVVQGANQGTGVALLELYDADTAVSPTAQFINLSIRGTVGEGSNVLTGGFSINGTTGETLLIRAVGPTLAQYGVSDALPDPQISVFNSADASLASNVSWGGSSSLSADFSTVGAFSLPPASHDSALVVTLGPGVYTAQVTSASGATGVALLEIYLVPSGSQ